MPDRQENVSDRADPGYYVSKVQPVSLLFVCRQIHTKTALLPYQLIHFRFDLTDASAFLGHISGDARNAITTISIPRINSGSDSFEQKLSALIALPNLNTIHVELGMPGSDGMSFKKSVRGVKAALVRVTGRNVRGFKVHSVM